MVELEEVDLVKALDMLSKLAARLARDIFTGLDSPERAHEVADVLGEATRLVRARACAAAPKVIELGDEDLTGEDRLAAALALHAHQVTLVVHEIRAGVFDQDERNELAAVMTALARGLRGA